MAYEVTATRRRPQRFEDLIGQEFVVSTFKNSIQAGKIAHAYLFSGPRGCGKTSTARILAKALNCQQGTGATAIPCCSCTACKEITKGSSMDVIEIDGASNTSVNDVRQIKDEVLFPPNSCRYKIYIIDEVHMLSTSAFNALLKTIEEPPPYVIFIFATTELQKVPATIKSRCQQFNFRLVGVEQVKNLLGDAAKEIGVQYEDEALYWIARETTGSIRDAYTLFDQVASFSDGFITYDKIRDKLGLVGVDRLNDLFEKCVNAETENVVALLDDYLGLGISIEQLISNSADYLRSLLLLKNGVKKEALLGQSPERFSQTVLSSWSSVQLERALSIFLQLYRDIRYSLSPRFELELAFSRLCWLKEYVSPAEVKKSIDFAKKLLLADIDSNGGLGKRSVGVESHTSVNYGQQGASFDGKNSSSTLVVQNVQKKNPFPMFSALNGQKNSPAFDENSSNFESDNLPPNDSNFSGEDYSSYEGENSSPFYDGGALPPKQTEAAAFSAETIMQKLIETLKVKDKSFIVSSLMQVNSYELKDDSFFVTVDNVLKKNTLEKHKTLLDEVLSEICAKQMSFYIEIVVQKNSVEEKVAIPENVKMLCNVFRGTIVGGEV